MQHKRLILRNYDLKMYLPDIFYIRQKIRVDIVQE